MDLEFELIIPENRNAEIIKKREEMGLVTKLYRYADYELRSLYSCGWDNITDYVKTYDVIRETPKGYWIEGIFDYYYQVIRKKWVPKEGKNIFAFANSNDALFNYIKRKECHIECLEARIKQLKYNMGIAKKQLNKDTENDK